MDESNLTERSDWNSCSGLVGHDLKNRQEMGPKKPNSKFSIKCIKLYIFIYQNKQGILKERRKGSRFQSNKIFECKFICHLVEARTFFTVKYWLRNIYIYIYFQLLLFVNLDQHSILNIKQAVHPIKQHFLYTFISIKTIL